MLPTGQIDLKNYKIKEIKEEAYLFGGNWKEIAKDNRKLFIAYSTAHNDTLKTDEGYYIPEMYYFLRTGSRNVLLGYITDKDGFRNSGGGDFTIADHVHHDNEWMSKYFMGLSVSCIESPFSITSIGKNTVTGQYYETDVIALLAIDDETQSLYQYVYEW